MIRGAACMPFSAVVVVKSLSSPASVLVSCSFQNALCSFVCFPLGRWRVPIGEVNSLADRRHPGSDWPVAFCPPSLCCLWTSLRRGRSRFSSLLTSGRVDGRFWCVLARLAAEAGDASSLGVQRCTATLMKGGRFWSNTFSRLFLSCGSKYIYILYNILVL